MATKQEVILVKELISTGYKDKHIQMITHLKQPYISKVRNGKLQANTFKQPNEEVIVTDEQQVRLGAVNKILSLPEFHTGEPHQDMIYIHVLKFFMVDKDDVFDLYFHMSKGELFRLWIKKDVDIIKFNSELIGIPYKTYLDLIIDFFIEV